ncbi:spore coat protein U domain-containing protein [Dongshaea marina]|uniref:spore coat protein U domain-containing protein n=1 Tax=Dongshaea marina TaxID=2047966 RepID=UPI000D3E11EE|nr:spore coat protein U domain-containing protein [Dongshaea marina]
MDVTNSFRAATIAVGLCLLNTSPAIAQESNTANAELHVSATVVSSCKVTVDGDMNFGRYNPQDTKPTKAVTGIDINCVGFWPRVAELSISSDSPSGRPTYKMYKNGSPGENPLKFSLYTHHGWWGNKIIFKDGKDQDINLKFFDNNHIRLHGKIIAHQYVPAGQYKTTLRVFVHY